MDITKTLIDKAAKAVGSQREVAKRLGVGEDKLSQWKHGHAPIQPDDLAAIAHLAGYNAINVLAAATIHKAAGTPKGALLDEALGKLWTDSEQLKNSASVRLIQWGITLINNIQTRSEWLRMQNKPVLPAIQTSYRDPMPIRKK